MLDESKSSRKGDGIMKRLALLGLLALVVISSGCVDSESSPEEQQNTEVTEKNVYQDTAVTGIDRVIFEDDGVVCYAFDDGYGGGLSCMPVNETEVGR